VDCERHFRFFTSLFRNWRRFGFWGGSAALTSGCIILDAFFPSGENVDVRSLLLRAAKIWVFFSQGQVVLLKRECEVSRARRFADNSILRRDTR